MKKKLISNIVRIILFFFIIDHSFYSLGSNQLTYQMVPQNNDIVLEIKGQSINPDFYKNIMEVLISHDYIDRPYSKVKFKFQNNSSIRILFNISDNDLILFKRILDKLRILGIRELKETAFSIEFYSKDAGKEILNQENYNDAIRIFLKDEKRVVNGILKKFRAKTLIEGGCGEGENFTLAEENQLNYVGVDVNDANLLKLKNKIKNSEFCQSKTCSYVSMDIGEYCNEYTNNMSQAILLLPFNLIGNIYPLADFLTKLKKSKLSFIISIYKNDAITLSNRKKYYTKCKCTNIQERHYNFGVSLTSNEGLSSFSYNSDYLIKILENLNYKIELYRTKYGIIIFGQYRNV